jgi:hypothetical protein
VCLFILSACGGGTRGNPDATRLLHGRGFSFAVPAAWRSSSGRRILAAHRGAAAVSVRTFALTKQYDPAQFPAAAQELDGIAAKLAAAAGKPLAERETVTVADRKIRAYRFGATRIGFLLVGRTEYQLLCRLGAGGGDPDGACALLFSSFSVS